MDIQIIISKEDGLLEANISYFADEKRMVILTPKRRITIEGVITLEHGLTIAKHFINTK